MVEGRRPVVCCPVWDVQHFTTTLSSKVCTDLCNLPRGVVSVAQCSVSCADSSRTTAPSAASGRPTHARTHWWWWRGVLVSVEGGLWWCQDTCKGATALVQQLPHLETNSIIVCIILASAQSTDFSKQKTCLKRHNNNIWSGQECLP